MVPGENRGLRSKMAVLTILFSYAAAGASYLIQFWLARQLGDDQYGIFSFGILVANVLQTTLMFGSDRTLIRDLVQSAHPRRTFLDSTWLRLGLTALLTPLAATGILLSGESTVSQQTLLLGLGFGVASALTPMTWYDFRGTMHLQTGLLLLEKVLFGVGVILISVWLHVALTPVIAAAVMTGAAFVGLGIQWWGVSGDVLPVEADSRPNLTGMFLANIAVLLAALGNMCMTHANQFILAGAVGKAGLAHYSISFQLTRMVHLFLGQYVRICAPEIARATREDALGSRETRRAFQKHLGQSILVAAGIAVPLYFVGRIAILSILPESYRPAIPILMILCLWCVIFGPASIINRFLLSLHLQKWFFVSAVVFGLFSVLLGWMLVPEYGGVGAAWALLMGHGLSAVFQGYFVVRVLYHADRDLQPDSENGIQK